MQINSLHLNLPCIFEYQNTQIMDTILDINGIQTITSKESIYKEMIEECEMRIFDLNEVVYELSADSQLCQKFERRIEVYKSIVNRLTQRIHTL